MSAPRARSHGFLQLTESQHRHQQEALRRREALRAREEARLPAMRFGTVSAGSTGSQSQPRARTPPPFLATAAHRSLSPVPLCERAQPNRDAKVYPSIVTGAKYENEAGKPPAVPDPRSYSFSYRPLPAPAARVAARSSSTPHRPASPLPSQQEDYQRPDATPPQRANSAPRSGATSRHRPRSGSVTDTSPRARQRARVDLGDAPEADEQDRTGGGNPHTTAGQLDKEDVVGGPAQTVLPSFSRSDVHDEPTATAAAAARCLALPRPGLSSSSPPTSTPIRLSSTRWANEFPLPRISAVAAPLLERLSSSTPQRRPFAGLFPTPATTPSRPASSTADATHGTPANVVDDVVYIVDECAKAGSPTPTVEGLMRSLQASAEKRSCECARPTPDTADTSATAVQQQHKSEEEDTATKSHTMTSPVPHPTDESMPLTSSLTTEAIAAAAARHAEECASSPRRRSAQPTPASTTPSCMAGAAAAVAGSPPGFSPSPWPTSAGPTGHMVHSMEAIPQPPAHFADDEKDPAREHTPSPSLSEHHVELSLYASAEKRPRNNDAAVTGEFALDATVAAARATASACSPEVRRQPQATQSVVGRGDQEQEGGAEADKAVCRVHTPTPSPAPTPKAVAASVLASADKRRAGGHVATPAPSRPSHDTDESASPASVDFAGAAQRTAIPAPSRCAQDDVLRADDDDAADSASPLRMPPRHAIVLPCETVASTASEAPAKSDAAIDSLPPASTPSPVPTREHLDCSVFASAEKRPRGAEATQVSGSPSRTAQAPATPAASPCSPLATSASPTLTTRNITDSVHKLRRRDDASGTTRSGAPEPPCRSWPTEVGACVDGLAAPASSQPGIAPRPPPAASPSVTAEDVSQALDVLQERQTLQSRSGPVERHAGSLDGGGPHTNKENISVAIANTALITRQATATAATVELPEGRRTHDVAAAAAEAEPEYRAMLQRISGTMAKEDKRDSGESTDGDAPMRATDSKELPVASPALSEVCAQSAMFVDCRSAPPTPALPHLPAQYLQLERDVAAIVAGRTRAVGGDEDGRGSTSPTVPPATRGQPRRSSLALVGEGIEGGPGGCAAPVQVPHTPVSPLVQQGMVADATAPMPVQPQHTTMVSLPLPHDGANQAATPITTRNAMTEDVAVQVGRCLLGTSDKEVVTTVSRAVRRDVGGPGDVPAGCSPLPRPVTLRSQVGPQFARQRAPFLPQPCTSLSSTARLVAMAAAPPQDDNVASFVLDPPTPVNPMRYPSRLAEARRAAATALVGSTSAVGGSTAKPGDEQDGGRGTPCQRTAAASAVTPHAESNTSNTAGTSTVQRRVRAAGSGLGGSGRRSEVQRLLEMLPQDVADEVRLSTGTAATTSTTMTTSSSPANEEETVGGSPGDRPEALSMAQRVAQRPRRVYYDYGYYLMYLNEQQQQQQQRRRHHQQRDGKRKASRGGTASSRGRAATPHTHADSELPGRTPSGSHARRTPAGTTAGSHHRRPAHDVTEDTTPEHAKPPPHELQVSTRLSAELQNALFRTPPPRGGRGSASLTAERTPGARSEPPAPASRMTPARADSIDDGVEGAQRRRRRRHPARAGVGSLKQRRGKLLRAKKGRRQR